MASKRRIFVGLAVPKQVKQEIVAWQKRYRELPVRWLAPENLHLTIIPPWYEEDIQGVVSKVQGIAMESFEINLARISYRPNPRHPRLIWAQGPVVGGLLRLKDRLEATLGREAAIKDYFAHLTLARFEEKRFREFKIKNLDEKVSWRLNFNSFVLFESHLRRSGAQYQTIWQSK